MEVAAEKEGEGEREQQIERRTAGSANGKLLIAAQQSS